tara:strand:+ start:605 stop:1777 length:1173 start_codon:yes stop_codon:yes gene_type:complete
MNDNLTTIEDLLEALAGLRTYPRLFVEANDASIMFSIAKQTFKGTALTDRQFLLMQTKLQPYKEQFIDCNFDNAIATLRQPLRQIDRSKYIKIIDDTIEIRFPFRKSEIMLIESISHKCSEYFHKKGTHKHIFALTEKNILNILDQFKNKNFAIDKELLDMYDIACDIRSRPQDYLSGVFNNKLLNINKKLKPFIEEEIGTNITNETVIKFIDRRLRYGNVTDSELVPNSLVEKIACRNDKHYSSKPSVEPTRHLLDALLTLDRLPLLVVLDYDDAEGQLYDCINHFRDILESSTQSVLFRHDGLDCEFNNIIKQRKLNNWVDKTTKIVYISNNKLPKILVNNEWKPNAVLSFNSRVQRFVDDYINFNSDLIVFREETTSPFRKYSRFYG